MTVHLERQLLVIAYELLVLTRPFRAWKMPPSSEIGFRVMSTELTRGAFNFVNGRPTIYISRKCVGTLHSLVHTMAHEMVHLHEDTRHRARGDVMHSSRFKRLAAQVCHHHGFDPKLF